MKIKLKGGEIVEKHFVELHDGLQIESVEFALQDVIQMHAVSHTLPEIFCGLMLLLEKSMDENQQQIIH